MDLAIKELKSRIDCYDFWVRDCSPYFKESKEKYEIRLKELTDTLEQLRAVLLLCEGKKEETSNESEVCPSCKSNNIQIDYVRLDLCNNCGEAF